MQAIFRFNGSEEIGISTQAQGVIVEHVVTHPASPEERAVVEAQKFGNSATNLSAGSAYIDDSGFFRQTMAHIWLSKSGARSIASALMQAAAEL